MTIEKVTPILIVEAIEPALTFWVDQLGYTKTTEVPHGDRLGFVILTHGSIELMLQTRASIADDLPAVLESGATCALFAEVRSLEGALAATKGAKVVVPPRTTFYGMREAVVIDPGGHPVVFAEPVSRAK